jgi:hypothetical protein
MYLPNGTLSVGGNASNNTYMNGKFIASQVTTNGQSVIWNAYNCSSGSSLAKGPISPDLLVNTQSIVATDEVPDQPTMTATVTPNPTQTYFTLRIQSTCLEDVVIKVYDMAGRQIEQMNGSVGQSFQFGGRYTQGMYIVEVHQANMVKVLKVIKM